MINLSPGRLTKEQIKQLETKVSARVGDSKDKQQLAKDSLGLVESLAGDFLDRGLAFTDLIDAGAEGLAVAARKFVAGKADFSTYATWWIRQSILRTIAARARIIRLPAALRETVSKLVSARRRLLHSLEREPSNKELAEAAGIAIDTVSQIMEITDNLHDLNRLDLEES